MYALTKISERKGTPQAVQTLERGLSKADGMERLDSVVLDLIEQGYNVERGAHTSCTLSHPAEEFDWSTYSLEPMADAVI